MGTNENLFKDENGGPVDPTFYRNMIGSLLYLTTNRPDIVFSVGVCARYQANPKKSHVRAIKRIIMYVNGTVDYGIVQDTLVVYYDNASAINICSVI